MGVRAEVVGQVVFDVRQLAVERERAGRRATALVVGRIVGEEVAAPTATRASGTELQHARPVDAGERRIGVEPARELGESGRDSGHRRSARRRDRARASADADSAPRSPCDRRTRIEKRDRRPEARRRACRREPGRAASRRALPNREARGSRAGRIRRDDPIGPRRAPAAALSGSRATIRGERRARERAAR